MNAQLPAEQSTPLYAESPNALSILLDDRLFRRCEIIADKMANAGGVTPVHLLNKPAACFAVVATAINWRLNPFAVARCTYQTPGGQIGYEGKLCQAILEVSGKLEGNVKFEHFGDWSKVKGKYEIRRSEKSGKDFARATWTRKDAEGLGVIVSAQVRGETEPRILKFDLDDCFPLNSTLWATRPQQQICYTAIRAFANLAAPGLFMGVPFDRDDGSLGMVIEGDEIPPPRPKRENLTTAGHADLDAEYRQTMREPAPTHDPETGEIEQTESVGASPETLAYAGTAPASNEASLPTATTPSEAVTDGAPSQAEQLPLTETAKSDPSALYRAVKTRIDAAATEKALGNIKATDPDLAKLHKADPDRYDFMCEQIAEKAKKLRASK